KTAGRPCASHPPGRRSVRDGYLELAVVRHHHGLARLAVLRIPGAQQVIARSHAREMEMSVRVGTREPWRRRDIDVLALLRVQLTEDMDLTRVLEEHRLPVARGKRARAEGIGGGNAEGHVEDRIAILEFDARAGRDGEHIGTLPASPQLESDGRS